MSRTFATRAIAVIPAKAGTRPAYAVIPAKAGTHPTFAVLPATQPAYPVIPAKAGIHFDFAFALTIPGKSRMDPGFRRDHEQEQQQAREA